MIDRFGERINELEAVAQEIAIDITTGIVVDRLPPKNVWDKTLPKISLIRALIKELNEYLHILKPEKTPTIQRRVAEIFKCLDIIQESLKVYAVDHKGDAQVSVDAIRQHLTEISKFVSLCRAIKTEPSEVILSVLTLREGMKTETPTLTHNKMQHLGDLIKKAQSTHDEQIALTIKTGKQITALNEEYERLHFTARAGAGKKSCAHHETIGLDL